VGLFYPTVIRGNGVGFATGMGRVAAIVGPVIAGYLLSMNLPLPYVLGFIAAPYAVVAASALALNRLHAAEIAPGGGARALSADSSTPVPGPAPGKQPA
jgi:AAHS family benzoate transporter-like MFS transporter